MIKGILLHCLCVFLFSVVGHSTCVRSAESWSQSVWGTQVSQLPLSQFKGIATYKNDEKNITQTDLKIKLLLVLYLWPVCACIRRVFFSQALVSVEGPPHPAPGSLLVQNVSAVGWCLLHWQRTDYSSHQACTDICCVLPCCGSSGGFWTELSWCCPSPPVGRDHYGRVFLLYMWGFDTDLAILFL